MKSVALMAMLPTCVTPDVLVIWKLAVFRMLVGGPYVAVWDDPSTSRPPTRIGEPPNAIWFGAPLTSVIGVPNVHPVLLSLAHAIAPLVSMARISAASAVRDPPTMPNIIAATLTITRVRMLFSLFIPDRAPRAGPTHRGLSVSPTAAARR